MADLGGGAGPLGERVDPAQQPAESLVGLTGGGGEVPGQPHALPVDAGQTASEPDPACLQRRQVHLAPARAVRQLQGRLPPGRGRRRVLLQPAGEDARGIEPPADVQPPACPRNAGVGPGGEGDLAAGGCQVVCQLHAGGGGADHQDAAAGEGSGGAVGRGRQLHDPGVEPGRQGGDVREVTPAGGQDDRRGRPGSGGRHDVVAAAGPPDGEYLDALGHGCGGQRGVAAQVVAYLGGAREAGRVGPAVAVARPTAQPVRVSRRSVCQG